MPEAIKPDLLALRKPFPPEAIGKLPRGGAKLDYVGHADVTARLLDVDPAWNWEPLAYEDGGLPRFDLDKNGNPVGFWIKLTVHDVTRLGYGSCPSDQRDAVKVLIGDALRNAAMRFGVALDLWAKGDRADPTAENPSGSAGQANRSVVPRGAAGHSSAKTSGPGFTIPQELIVAAHSATEPEQVRSYYKTAGTAGWLKMQAAHPESGEKVSVEDFLTAKGNDLKHKSSSGSGAKSPRGEGNPR
jgi:hypothetical protein